MTAGDRERVRAAVIAAVRELGEAEPDRHLCMHSAAAIAARVVERLEAAEETK